MKRAVESKTGSLKYYYRPMKCYELNHAEPNMATEKILHTTNNNVDGKKLLIVNVMHSSTILSMGWLSIGWKMVGVWVGWGRCSRHLSSQRGEKLPAMISIKNYRSPFQPKTDYRSMSVRLIAEAYIYQSLAIYSKPKIMMEQCTNLTFESCIRIFLQSC